MESKTCRLRLEGEIRATPYRANKSDYIARNKRAAKAVRDFLSKYKEGKICRDCGLPHPAYRLHFDHLPGTKKRFIVSHGYTRGLTAVMAEIAKCELVCANCHADRTFSRLSARHQVVISNKLTN